MISEKRELSCLERLTTETSDREDGLEYRGKYITKNGAGVLLNSLKKWPSFLGQRQHLQEPTARHIPTQSVGTKCYGHALPDTNSHRAFFAFLYMILARRNGTTQDQDTGRLKISNYILEPKSGPLPNASCLFCSRCGPMALHIALVTDSIWRYC